MAKKDPVAKNEPDAKRDAAPAPAAAPSRPKITIDGRVLEFQPGQTILQVAHAAGIEVPHYCYHPGLSIAGNCRVCMVEIEKNPRPQVACYVQAQDGMVVHTTSAVAKDARAQVMEFLLVNHPLDCPICDQAGECRLQDFAYEFGWPTARTPVEKTRLPKNVPFGETVVYDAERCIKCTRCVRFTDEVSRSHELSMGNRGDAEIVVMTSRGEFSTPYALNIVDLCPVGALTSRDFRFESRLWFMDFTDSICTGCARGCNVVIGGRGGRFLRMTPRENQAVNRWWMCDPGRLGYKFVNSPTRAHSPHVRGADGVLAPAPMDVALAEAGRALRGAPGGVLLDAGLSLEEMFLLSRLAEALGAGGKAVYASTVGDDGDDFLLVNEKGANQRGAEALGLARAAAGAKASVLAVERDGNVPAALRDACGAVVALVSDLAHAPASAKVVLPLATWAEKDGLFVNVDGIVQRVRRAAGVGPRDLPDPLAVLEGLLFEASPDEEPWGRLAVVDALRALPAFESTRFPRVAESPADLPRSLGAPAGRTR
jgi:NADH-quinone oxidoreductase subunit G